MDPRRRRGPSARRRPRRAARGAAHHRHRDLAPPGHRRRPPANGWSCCPCCTGRWARTARSRACSSWPTCPTSVVACSPRPWRWTRPRRRSSSPPTACRRPNGRAFTRPRSHDPDLLARLADELGFPMFVKPANMGSSVGVSKARDADELRAALTQAAQYDEWLVVEEAIDGREIECAVLGNLEPRASLPGEIEPGADFYDYDDKYNDGRAKLLIPAPLADERDRGTAAPGVRRVHRLAVRRHGPRRLLLRGGRSWPAAQRGEHHSRASHRSRCTRRCGKRRVSATASSSTS